MGVQYNWVNLNPNPLTGGINFFERGTRHTQVGTPTAYSRTWVVGQGAGYGQPMMLKEPPARVGSVGSLPIMYTEAFGYYVGDYPGEFDTLAEAEEYARFLLGTGEAPSVGSPLPLVALLALLILV